MKSRPQASAQDLVEKPSPAGWPRHLEESTASTWWLAHEFGNLLTGILGFAELCLPLTPPGSEAHQYLCEIHQTARQGQEFIRQFLAADGKHRPARGALGSATTAASVAPAGQPS